MNVNTWFTSNMWKILLLFVFMEFIRAEETCDYEIQKQKTIKQTDGVLSITTTANDVYECAQKCCDEKNCSAALYLNTRCILFKCKDLEGHIVSIPLQHITLVVVKRDLKADNGNNNRNKQFFNDGEKFDLQDDLTLRDIENTDLLNSGTTQSGVTNNENNLTTVPVGDGPGQSGSLETSLESVNKTNDPILEATVYEKELPTSEPSTDQITTSLAVKLDSTTSTSTPVKPVPTSAGTTPTEVVNIPSVITTNPVEKLTKALKVTTGGNQEVRLPVDIVTIHAEVEPKSDSTPYDYQWNVLRFPESFQGTQSGMGTETMKLETLAVGTYEFKVEVRGENAYGEDFVNVTVLPKPRVNQPPVAVISPPFQSLTLPTDATLLDGSKSSDDDEIVKYEWEEVQGPLQAKINKDENGNLPNTKVLQLTGLTVGNYTFKLTVTDTDKATDSTEAVIVVKNKIDNPPIANAGSNQVIHLPQKTAILCGNDSTDDWGIVSYKWSLSPDSKNEVADMQGARSKCLVLSNLEIGDYTFQLQVTDEAGQEDTAKVTIIVQPESNHPPVAHAGEDQQVLLPLDRGPIIVTLDGEKSTDDKEITTFLWVLKSGPQVVSLTKNNACTTTVNGISVAGEYVFTLTVTDEDGAASSDDVTVTVKEEQPPIANAGPDILLVLPDNVAVLDGTRSTDDYGITEYEWTRSDESPAAGHVLNRSDHLPVLHVADLVQGTYKFQLKVTNLKGKSSTDEAEVVVKPDQRVDNLVELHLDANILRFNENHKETIIRQLSVLLSLQTEDSIVVTSVYAEHGTSHMILLFYVETKEKGILSALTVSESLNSKLKSGVALLEFKFLRADTYVCENLCSGHGRCRGGSKECECEMFWMENFFRVYMGDGRRNCEWSVMYVGIICFFLLSILSCLVWFLTCYCLRKKRLKSPYKRRKTYDKTRYEKLPLKPQRMGPNRKNGYVRNSQVYKSSSIMRSASSSSTDLSGDEKENTLFEKKRLLIANGNGGGRHNGSFINEGGKRKSSSSSNGKNSFSMTQENMIPIGKIRNGNGHQSALLRVGNSSGEDVL